MTKQSSRSSSNQKQQPEGVLIGLKDMYHGITIDLCKSIKDETCANRGLIHQVEAFRSALEKSIAHWVETSVRGVWISIHISQSHLIPILAEQKFEFHHTEPDCVFMTRWLPDPLRDPGALPRFCQHYIGAGGCVIDIARKKVLLITEKFAWGEHRRKKTQVGELPPWKIPGGQLDDPDEAISEAAIREVREETGIESEFVAMLGFRHMHNFRFAKSDFYFVCLLKPKDDSVLAEPNPDYREISLCKWTDLDEYFSFTHLNNVQTEIQKAVKLYLEDPTKCLAMSDITEHRKKALWFSLAETKEL